jgi:hypothetical protein
MAGLYQQNYSGGGGLSNASVGASFSTPPNMSFTPAIGETDPQLTQKLAGQANVAQIGANAAMYPATLQQQRFNTGFGYLTNNLIPWAQGQFGNLVPGGSGSGALGGAGGAAGSAGAGSLGPNIQTGGVYNPQQIQSQVNTMRAQNDQGMNTQNKAAAAKMGGQGFGTNSPLLDALQGQNAASTLQANTTGEQQLRSTAAQQNAQQLLSSQQAMAQQFSQAQSNLTAQRGQNLSTISSLLGALGSYA